MLASQNQTSKDLTFAYKQAVIYFEAVVKNKVTPAKQKLLEDLCKIKDIKTKRYIVRELILHAVSDNELTDVEVSAIYSIGQKIGVCQDKVDDMFIWAAQGMQWHIDGNKLIEADL